MGDVALTVPVVKASLEQNPDINITILTRQAFVPLFDGLKVDFVLPDLYGKHKGVLGLYQLFKELKSRKKWDAVLDLHNVLRSKILRTYFKLSGVHTYQIDKGRKEKKALTTKNSVIKDKLKHSCERYAEVFSLAGLELDLSNPTPSHEYVLSEELQKELDLKNQQWIGIAPFTQHQQKMYPLDKMKSVIKELAQKGNKIFIFGGGKKENELAEDLSQELENTINLIGRYSLSDELGLLSQMDVVLSMDSANMHMAALTGTKVVSIWGATHPYAGFTPFGQDNEEQMIQISPEELPCRPCSVFGNKPCHREDLACMNRIDPKDVVKKVESILYSPGDSKSPGE